MDWKKKVEILGLEVPVLAIIALVTVPLVAGASLTFYGQITGSAQIEQSVILDDSPCDPNDASCTKSFDFSPVTAGTKVIETHTMENNHPSNSEKVFFKTNCKNDQGQSENPQSNNKIIWSNVDKKGCNGIKTKYVEYFDDAGHDFSDYSVDKSCTATVSSGSSIQTAIGDADPGDVICVGPGTYDEDLTISKALTLVAQNAPDTGNRAIVDGRIDIKVDGVNVKGFKIQNPSASGSGEKEAIFVGDSSGFSNTGDEVVIDSNIFAEYDATATGSSAQGIHAKYYSGDQIDGLVISNNWFKGVTTNKGAYGMMLQADLNDVTVKHNTVEGLEGGWEKALGITYSKNEDGYPKNVEVTYNHFEGMLGLDDVPGSEVTVTENNFVGDFDLSHINSGQDDFPDEELVANKNWFGTDGIKKTTEHPDEPEEFEGSIAASYKKKSDMTLEPGENDKFGIINNFPMTLRPLKYTLTSKLMPE